MTYSHCFVQAVKEQLKGYEKGFVEGGKTKDVEKEMAYVQAQLKGYSEVCDFLTNLFLMRGFSHFTLLPLPCLTFPGT